MDALKKEKIKKTAWFEERKELKERLSTLDLGAYHHLITNRSLTASKQDKRTVLYEKVKADLFDEDHMKNDLRELNDLAVKTVKEIYGGKDVIDAYAFRSIRRFIDLGYFTKISHYRFTYDEETKAKVLALLNDPQFDEDRHKHTMMEALDEYVAQIYIDVDLDELYELWEIGIGETSQEEFFHHFNDLRVPYLVYNQKTKRFTAYDILRANKLDDIQKLHKDQEFPFTPFEKVDLEDFLNYHFPYHNDNFIELIELMTIHTDEDVCQILEDVIRLYIGIINDTQIQLLVKDIDSEWNQMGDFSRKDCVRLLEACYNTSRHPSCYGGKPINQFYKQVREGKVLIPKSKIGDRYDMYRAQILERGLDLIDIGHYYKVIFKDKDPGTLN